MNDLKSSGFLDNLSYESNERTFKIKYDGHKAVYANYARDLLITDYGLPRHYIVEAGLVIIPNHSSLSRIPCQLASPKHAYILDWI